MAADQPFANCDIGPEIGNVSRRSFIGAFGLGAGALVLGLPLPQSAARAATGGAPERVGTPFGAMLSIAPDGAVTFVCPSSEMGQGTQDALARILAEDLDCAWDTLTVRLPWADPAFINPAARKQLTANSMTVTGYCSMLRKAGASARAMLVAAAAERLGVAASELTTGNGRINHAATNRTLGYGDVAAAAALLPVPAGVALKQAKSFALIGTRRPRKDLLPKVTGTAEYGIDVQQEGMLVAALVLAPHPAATFTAEGLETARALPGVAAVVPVSGGVAVLADRFWRAHKAAAAITLKTATSPLGDLSDASLDAMLHAAFDTVPPQPFPNIDLSSYPFKMDYADKAVVSAAIDGAAHKLDVAYSVPHLAHAAMEPLVCAARLDDGQLLIRGPLQDPETSRQLGATLTGLPLDKVRVEVTFIGGGFGRKWGTDFVGVAVEAARGAPGRLVKTMWTREQDLAWDQFRPAFAVRSRAAIGPAGEVLAIHSRIAGESLLAYHKKPGMAAFKGLADPNSAAQLIYGVYKVPHKLIEYHPVALQVPIGFWRSVTMSQNAFFAESLIDEIARAARQDPYRMRRALLDGHARLVPLIDKAAQMIDWDKPRPKGVGRGIALSYADANYCVQAVEVEVKAGALKIRRIACAFDGGMMIDPVSVESQITGGIVFGLQAALWGRVHFENGAPTAQNFSDYRMPLLADVPPISVALMPGSDQPGNCGEASTPVIAPALCNAIADAGGPRIRALPITRTLTI
jgi:isoquinoline 1-oxidoreductase beta subunit